MLKTYDKSRTGGPLAKLAYRITCKSLDLARFLLIPERAQIGGVTPVGRDTKSMKTILTLIIVGALCMPGRAGTPTVLHGIRIVETQDQLHPPRGKLGERGPYQFRRSTWRMHTSAHFDLAENREVANTVAKRHYAWIQAQLQANGCEPSAYNVALAWNAGVNAVIRGNAPAVAHDYANRVLNIASTLPDEIPTPATQSPALAADETPAKANPIPALEPISTPVPVVSPVVEIASSPAPTTVQDDPHAVRYYTNSILLALNRTITPEPVAAVETPVVVPVEIASATLAAIDFPRTIGRM